MTQLGEFLKTYLNYANIQAWGHVLRQGESNQTDRAYAMVNGAHDLTDFSDHPYRGLSTLHGGHASGAYQAIPSTWEDFQKDCGPTDFGKDSQDLFMVWATNRRKALDDVVKGQLNSAVEKCRQEWTSLPGAAENAGHYTMAKLRQVFAEFGGVEEMIVGEAGPELIHLVDLPAAQEKPKMGALALLQMFAGPLLNLIPQIAPILKPTQSADTATKTSAYAQLAQTILDVIVNKTAQPNLQAAVEAMQAPTLQAKALTKEVQQAVVSHPEVIQFMEVGGGFAAARDSDLKMQAAANAPDARPFYKTSAVFWVSVLLLPLVYWLVGSLIVGGVSIPSDAPWYVQLFRLFGGVWNGESRSGGFNLVIGLVLGGICGVYYGISVTQQKQTQSTSTGEGHGV